MDIVSSGVKLCQEIVEKPDIMIDLKGAERLRRIVEWMNNRPEKLNENKSHIELIKEYNNERKSERVL